jgi:hypothetical protein
MISQEGPMFLFRAVPLAGLLVTAGCYHTNVLRLDHKPHFATHLDSVRLLGQEPAEPYTVLAIVSVSSESKGLESIRRRLLKEAARLGGDAVLLETGSLTQVGVGGEYGGTARQLSGKVIVFKREQRAAHTQ